MTIEEMTLEALKDRKKELGYTSRMIAEQSGVPLSTVQKIFAGLTRSPHTRTLQALEAALYPQGYGDCLQPAPAGMLQEKAAVYRTDPKQGSYTLADYYALPDDRRVELIDGWIYDMAAPGKLHQALLLQLSAQLLPCVDNHPECQLFFAPCDVRLDDDDRTIVQPDVFIVCDDSDNDPRRVNSAPAFIIEVLSPSNRFHDLFRKLNKYRFAGVKEYWIVDPENQQILVYDLLHDSLPEKYTFSDTIPILLSGGECSVNFRKIREKIRRYLPQAMPR